MGAELERGGAYGTESVVVKENGGSVPVINDRPLNYYF